MDFQSSHSSHDGLYSCRRLKIRRSPSYKVSASPPAKSLSSFHGSCSTTINQQPLIIHTFDPETIVAEPDEFMWVVQRLTGSPDTRRSLRASKRNQREVQSMQVQDVQLMQQSNYSSLNKGATASCTEAALMTGDSSRDFSVKEDHPSSPLSSNSSDLGSDCITPLVSPLSPDTNYQYILKNSQPSSPKSGNYSEQRAEHPPSPLSPSSCKYHPCQLLPLINPSHPCTPIINNYPSPYPSPLSISNTPSPLSPNPSNPCTLTSNPSTLITNNNPPPLSPSPSNPSTLAINNNSSPLSPNLDTSPLSPISCNSGSTNNLSLPVSSIIKASDQRNNRDHPGSPLSPTSGLTASSEDCQIDLSSECCISPMEEPLPPLHGIVNNMEADEDGSNFFVFSFNSYYGSHAAQDELDFLHSSVLENSSCSSMILNPTEAFNLSFLVDHTTWLPMMD